MSPVPPLRSPPAGVSELQGHFVPIRSAQQKHDENFVRADDIGTAYICPTTEPDEPHQFLWRDVPFIPGNFKLMVGGSSFRMVPSVPRILAG